jgi:alanyl-tRNA synthetase
VPLPKPSIDTGMGLERIAAVMQGVPDNYDTDTFKALIAASEELTGTKAQGEQQASHRVIADHLRSTSFLLADGVMPSNEGRGYVLRRIMRRAMRHAHLLGAKEPLMHRLVGSLAAEMGAAYPELLRAQPLIEATLRQEETQFRRTLDKGLKLLDEATAGFGAGAVLAGETAFKLYDTYGFPYDLTEDALRAQGFGIDRAGFDTAMDQQKAMARAAWKGSGAKASDEVWFDIAERVGSTEFTGYSATEGEGQVVALVNDGIEVQSAVATDTVTVITNQTPFYGESGGQMGDAGTLAGANMRGEVTDTAKPLGRLHAHQVSLVSGEIKVGDVVQLRVDGARRDAIRANHSATHLLHAALRQSLGDHVTQKGSMVAPDRLRFDFSHNQAVTADEIAAVETAVNAQIRGNRAVTTRLMAPEDAVAAGALALFGEKYGDEVRVLSMGDVAGSNYSVELCGGTHVQALGDIALFKIVSEGAVASGIRRIEALTGEAARLWLTDRDDRLKEIAAMLRANPDEAPARVVALADNVKRLEKELADAKRAIAMGGSGGGASEAEQINGVTFVSQSFDALDPKELRNLANDARQQMGSGVVAYVTVNDGRASVLVALTEDLTASRSAVDLVRVAVEALGGQGGGGKAEMAQGGGPDGTKAQEALDAIRAVLAA